MLSDMHIAQVADWREDVRIDLLFRYFGEDPAIRFKGKRRARVNARIDRCGRHTH